MSAVSQETLDFITMELEMIGVPLAQQLKILRQVKDEGFNPKQIDMKLVKMGYNAVFEDCYEDE
jgi:hypothetical protein